MRMWGIVGLAVALIAAAPAARPVLVLDENGLTIGARSVKFDRTTKAQAIAAVTAALGPPIGQGNHGDCATDHIVYYAKFRGDFELSFVSGKFVGWTADAAGPRTARGIGVGATLAQVRRAYPQIDTTESDEENGGLGASFTADGAPSGWLDGTRPTSRVIGLYSGATCIVN